MENQTPDCAIGKLDLGSMFMFWMMHRSVRGTKTVNVEYVGSAKSEWLKNPEVTCLEAGSLQNLERDLAKNNFDEHVEAGTAVPRRQSATHQIFERMAKLNDYVSYSDGSEAGAYKFEELGKVVHEKEFISLSQLISGLKLVIKNPSEILENACTIFETILHTGINPYGNMLAIVDKISGAKEWAEAKWKNEKGFAEALLHSIWYKLPSGKKLAVVVSAKWGTPGKLHSIGADYVICFNPSYEIHNKVVSKFTIASDKLPLWNLFEKLSEKEIGWGLKDTGTIGGSPFDEGSKLSVEEVVALALELLA